MKTFQIYVRFLAMIGTATVVMYGLMYLNVYAFDDVRFSQMRVWMALIMGSVMAIFMIVAMLDMYKNAPANAVILACSVAIFCLSLYLARSQAIVDDVSYMKAMIPHHSIAILTSERAHIKDVRVRKLADGILQAQVREISEMKALIADLQANRPSPGAPDLVPVTRP